MENPVRENSFVRKVKDLSSSFVYPFKNTKDLIGKLSLIDKILFILNYFFNGIFLLRLKQIGSGLFHLIFEGFFIFYCIQFSGLFIGEVNSGFEWLIFVSYLMIFFFLWSFYSCYKNSVLLGNKHVNREYIKESGLITGVYNIFRNIKKYNKEVASVYRYGSAFSRFNIILSFFIIGVPQMLEKQMVKGICYFLTEVGFIVYMIFYGAQSFTNAINLEDYEGDHRTVLIYLILTCVLIVFFLFIYITAQRVTANKELERSKKYLTFSSEIKDLAGKKAYLIYLFLPVLGALVFTIIPIVFMILIGFTNFGSSTYGGLGQESFYWTGLDAFSNLFSMGDDLSSLAKVFVWTMIWSLLATFTCYFGGFFLAILLNNKLVKIKPLWRSAFVIVMAIPQFVSLKIMNSLFQDTGPINQLIQNGGGSIIQFWTNEYWAKFLIVVVNMWVGIPYNMLLISGLLMNIPQDNYEAAQIDGATKWQKFTKITFPYVFFMTTPLLITSFVSNINNFNVIWLLVGSSDVVNDTDIMITWLYKLTIMQNRYDLGSAIGIIMFIISATISLVIFRNSSAYKNEEEFR